MAADDRKERGGKMPDQAFLEAPGPFEPNRPELHASGFRAILEVAEQELGRAELDSVLSSLGVTARALQDPNGWFSLAFAEALMESLVLRSKDPALLDRAIKLAVSPEYLGILYPLFRSFGTPGYLYRQLANLIPRLNKVTTWVVERSGPHEVRVQVRRTPGAPSERTPYFCRVRTVQLAWGARLFDLPPAEVTHPFCMVRGDDSCTYEVEWKEHRRPLWSMGGLAVGLFLGAVISWFQATPAWLGALLSFSFGVSGWALARTRELRRDLGARIDDLGESHAALTRSTAANEQRYAELLEAKAEVELKVEQRTVELRAATQRLSETLDEIQALDRAKTDFFNNVSHELRSPLTMILAPLEDLISGRSPPGGERSAFESMHRNASRLLHLINQLLDLAKIDAGGMKITPTPTDLPKLVGAVLKGFDPAANKKRVALELSAPAAMSSVVLDPSWIESAITNLVANALRLSKAEGSVRVSVEDLGSEVVVSVADDGPGIAAEDQKKVFERFAQGDTTKRVIGGTGIGLALVREAARLHGGDVKLVSEAGKGATFALVLPRRPDTQIDQHSNATASSQPPPAVRLVGDFAEEVQTVERGGAGPDAPLALVVEDNPELREFIVDVLAVSYRVRAANDGAKALALLPDLNPDVIVSDVAMPEMDGYTLCRRLRANRDTASIPVVLVTARTEVASVLEGFDAGANDYVLKPFHGRELLARVDVHVRLRRMVQELALRERHAMLGVLAASVAHQVRNPLTTLVSGLPAMRGRLDGKVSQTTFDLIDIMIDCAGRIERLTRDLMDLSRVDREVDGEYRPADGLRAAIRLVRARTPDTVVIDEDITDPGIVEGRPGDMNHVYLNLLDNALRAVMPQGTIRVTAATEGPDYVIRVGDSGYGVDAQTAARVFEPFYTTRPAGEGTGLGLAIARQVLMQCGGSIALGRSELGGAQFVVHIPLVRRKSMPPTAKSDDAAIH
jgi:signal transduction histidine kinase